MCTTNKRYVMDYITWIIAISIVVVMFTNNPIMTWLDTKCQDYDDGV